MGDALHNEPELTPIAIRSGRLLARKLFNKITQKSFPVSEKDFYVEFLPTTTFTNPEYGVIGYSEEDALEKFGKEIVNCYHRLSPRLESVLFDQTDNGYFKVVCLVQPDLSEKVIGLHYLGKNAGEVIQGYTLAFQKGFTKKDLDKMVGIHPTVSEEFNSVMTNSKDGDLDAGSC